MEPVTSIWLPLVIGGLGYCMMWLFVRLGSQRTLPQQHAEVREKVISLAMRWIDAEQERLYCEHELARLRESAPDEESLWITHSIEQLNVLPPTFVHLARRFGFKVPDHDHVQQPTTVFVAEEPEELPEPEVVELPRVNAWGQTQMKN